MITVSNEAELKAVRYALAKASVARNEAAWSIECALGFSHNHTADIREIEHLLRQADELDELKNTAVVG